MGNLVAVFRRPVTKDKERYQKGGGQRRMCGRYDADFLDDALDNVELVTTDDDFLTLIQGAEGIECGLDSRTKDVSRNAGGVDSDGAIVNGSYVTFDIDTFLVCRGLIAADTDARRDEVTLVGIGLEADEVRAEHTVEDLLST